MYNHLCAYAGKECNKKFMQVNVKRDANCMFYSIAVGLHFLHEKNVLTVEEATTKGKLIRKNLCTFVNENQEEDFCENIIEKAYALGEIEVECSLQDNGNPRYTVSYDLMYKAYLELLEDHKCKVGRTALEFVSKQLGLNIVMLVAEADGRYLMNNINEAWVRYPPKVWIVFDKEQNHYDALIPGRGRTFICVNT